MSHIIFNYDYKDGEFCKGADYLDTKHIVILGRNIKQVVSTIPRADRTGGFYRIEKEMLIINYEGHEYGSENMTTDELLDCMCPVSSKCTTELCLDGCFIILDDCCLTLN